MAVHSQTQVLWSQLPYSAILDSLRPSLDRLVTRRNRACVCRQPYGVAQHLGLARPLASSPTSSLVAHQLFPTFFNSSKLHVDDSIHAHCIMASFVYSSNNEEEDGIKYCSCCRFTNGIDLPSPRDLTAKQILHETPHYAARILKNWVQLTACLKRFEPVIRKRWLKKTDKQRREILLKAWPEISRQHRPDFMGCRTRKRPKAIPRK